MISKNCMNVMRKIAAADKSSGYVAKHPLKFPGIAGSERWLSSFNRRAADVGRRTGHDVLADVCMMDANAADSRAQTADENAREEIANQSAINRQQRIPMQIEEAWKGFKSTNLNDIKNYWLKNNRLRRILLGL